MSSESQLPEFFPLHQEFASYAIDDLPKAVKDALAAAQLEQKIQPGQRVAVAVGSRGIANLGEIVGEVVRFVRDAGGDPLIVPAMGSHGGATVEGQTAILAKYGVDASLGCPIEASMETVCVGTTDQGVDVHFSKVASQADHVVVVNRVKPHTRLTGRYESGLIKMLMIGLGKQRGAALYHQVFPDYDYSLNDLAPTIVEMILSKMPVTLGLAIVEDAMENTSLIEAVAPDELLKRETELLEIAKSRMPRLPFDTADLLIVDQIGKEISGTGMDTNVIGRKENDNCAAADEFPKIREIYVRSLTQRTAGNACGIGVAEYTHRRVVDAMDTEVTKINCVTSGHVTAGAVPVTFGTDREVLQAVVSQIGQDRIPGLKWMWISDTLHVSELACSRAYWDEVAQRPNLSAIGQPRPLRFDHQDNLIAL